MAALGGPSRPLLYSRELVLSNGLTLRPDAFGMFGVWPSRNTGLRRVVNCFRKGF